MNVLAGGGELVERLGGATFPPGAILRLGGAPGDLTVVETPDRLLAGESALLARDLFASQVAWSETGSPADRVRNWQRRASASECCLGADLYTDRLFGTGRPIVMDGVVVPALVPVATRFVNWARFQRRHR